METKTRYHKFSTKCRWFVVRKKFRSWVRFISNQVHMWREKTGIFLWFEWQRVCKIHVIQTALSFFWMIGWATHRLRCSTHCYYNFNLQHFAKNSQLQFVRVCVFVSQTTGWEGFGQYNWIAAASFTLGNLDGDLETKWNWKNKTLQPKKVQ